MLLGEELLRPFSERSPKLSPRRHLSAELEPEKAATLGLEVLAAAAFAPSDPLPLPVSPGTFAKREALSLGQEVAAATPDLDLDKVFAADIEQRDIYWRGRVDGEMRVAKARIDAHWHKELMHERLRLQEELNEQITRREALETKQHFLEKELTVVRGENSELRSELQAGKLMIAQFSKLMADKASQICQYCRRSGTLKPLPMR